MTDTLQTTLIEGTHYFMHSGRMYPIVRGGDGPSDIGDTGAGTPDGDVGAGTAEIGRASCRERVSSPV